MFNDIFYSENSNNIFISDTQKIVKYSDIYKLSRDFKIKSRRVVICLIDNDIDGLAGYLSLMVADAIPLMLDVNISKAQLSNIIKSYDPNYIFLPSYRKNEVSGECCPISLSGYNMICISDNKLEINDELALLLGTSGSTGNPKFVRLSHENLLSNAKSISTYLDLNSDELPITTLPPSYSYGLSIIHSHLLVGATILVTNKTLFDIKFWNYLRSSKATSFAGVPYHYEILKKLRVKNMDLPHLRTFLQAGGRMEPSLTSDFADYCINNNKRFFTMYGQTEATARMSYLPSDHAKSKAGSIGIAIPGGEFWLVEENGELIRKTDVSGELVYKGSNVSMGYAKGSEDLAKGDERNGVLHTGDLAKRDDDGYYYIVGRLKRFIKLFGNRINLQDVEVFLRTEGYSAVCAGHDDLLEVYIEPSFESKAKQIKQKVAEYLKIALQGIVIYRMKKIPRNETGKVQYSNLKPDNSMLLV